MKASGCAPFSHEPAVKARHAVFQIDRGFYPPAMIRFFACFDLPT